ncbi:MAG: sulfite exporter TauE/SafE family protein [Solirubrobacterales bacterium]
MDPLLIVFGLGVGFLVGITGMGGGSLMTPLLILFTGTAPVTAIGSDIAYAAVTKTVGGWRHLKLKTVNLGLSFWLALGSVPAAIAGVWVLDILHHKYGKDLDNIVLTVLAVALVVVGTLVLIRSLFVPRMINGEREHFELTRGLKIAAVAIGATTGFVIGLTSAGSGTLIAVFLIALYRMAPRKVVGTDVFHAAVLLWAAAIAHLLSGNINFAIVGTILIGSIPGVWIGSHLTVKLPTGVLRTALGVVMIAAALALFDKAGANIPLGAVIGVGAAFALGLIVQQLVRHYRPMHTASSGVGD